MGGPIPRLCAAVRDNHVIRPWNQTLDVDGLPDFAYFGLDPGVPVEKLYLARLYPSSPRHTHKNDREQYPRYTDNRLIGISDGVTIDDSATMILHFVCMTIKEHNIFSLCYCDYSFVFVCFFFRASVSVSSLLDSFGFFLLHEEAAGRLSVLFCL